MSFGRAIALASFALTFGTIALAYLIGRLMGTVETCVPLLQGCTDITHVGMKSWGGYVFRGGMLASTAVLVIWWHIMARWLAPYGRRGWLIAMEGFGVLAAVGLLVGTAVLLPEKEGSPWKLHVQGANLFFQGMVVALNINYVLIRRARRLGLEVPSFRAKSRLMAILWLVLVAFVWVSLTVPVDDPKRVLEWWSTLFICGYFLTAWWDWGRVRLTVEG